MNAQNQVRRLMLKRATTHPLKPYFRRIHTRSTPGQQRRFQSWLAISSAISATAVWFTASKVVYNDAHPQDKHNTARQLRVDVISAENDSDSLHTLVWGSNKSNTILPGNPKIDSIPTPTVAAWLENVGLRDLALHLKHGACVDAHGDVYQWGDGFFGSESHQSTKPALTLRGKSIIQLQLTESRLFALSDSGKVYVLSTDISLQKFSERRPKPASTGWWLTRFWDEGEASSDFVELRPKGDLAWGEKFVSLAAGNDHLLALTSKGRTYAHPITKKANEYGQLGFRHFEIRDPTSTTNTPLALDLIPKSLADPYVKASPFARAPSPSFSSSVPGNVEKFSFADDSTIHFCTNLFEIPVLRGVEVKQIAAGGRSSFVLTQSGRVLGWGANEYGQIGLGSNVTLDTITVPTEVVLWGTTPSRAHTKCLNISAGGDLTCFIVEHVNKSSSATVDLLMCGNGQWGGLGGNVYSNAQGTPVRARNVSGLLEYNEQTNSLQPIVPHSVDISATGHVLLTLNASMAGIGGRDLVVWGKNHEFELGNGKRSSLSVPTMLSTPSRERFMLKTVRAKEVRDLRGKVWKRDVKMEERAVAGYGNSVVYWKICL